MYDTTFSEEWTELPRDEAVERAYALGVAAACGYDNREEYEEIKAAAGGAYDQSLIELSFDQGRSEALKLESSGTPPDVIWEQLVDGTQALSGTDTGLPDVLGPAALLDRLDQLEGPPSTLDKPSFLSRGEQDNV